MAGVDAPPGGGHGAAAAELAAAAIAGAYLGAGLVAHRLVPLWLPVAAVLAAAAVTVAGRRELAGWAAIQAALSCGWLAWARWTTPYAEPQAAVLAGGSILAGVAAYLALAAADGPPGGVPPEEKRDAAWHARLIETAAGLPGLRGLAREDTPSGCVVSLRLPKGGRVTLAALQQAAGQVEQAARWRRGAVRFDGDPDDSSLVWMHVAERRFLAADVPFPAVTAPLTVTRPLPVGVREDGTPAQVLFREAAVLIGGVTGGGKSVLINTLIGLFSWCSDTVVWVIDGKGGRLAAPWLVPWVEGKTPRPVIDWVAVTPGEAMTMLTAARAWLDARTASLAGGSKLVPSPGLPQLVLICDETADLMGHADRKTAAAFAEAGGYVTRKGRSEAVMAVWSDQRTTSPSLPAAIKSQCRLRLALQTATMAEASYILPDDYRAARLLASLTSPGTGLAWAKGTRDLAPVKFYRLDPAADEAHGAADLAKIRAIAAAAGAVRPEPEPAAAAAMGAAYARRWDDSELYARLAPAVPAAAVPARPAELSDAQVADAFAALRGRLGDLDVRAEPHPAKARILSLVAERPQVGCSAGELAARLRKEGLAPEHRATVYKWLDALVSAGHLEKRAGLYRPRRDGGQGSG